MAVLKIFGAIKEIFIVKNASRFVSERVPSPCRIVMPKISELIGYKGFAEIYGHEFVCNSKGGRFDTYKLAHEWIARKKLSFIAPYQCKTHRDHYHLSKDKPTLELYRLWKQNEISIADPTDKNKARKRIRKIRYRKRKALRLFAWKLNFGQDHQTIMDEIELGF